MPPAVTVGDAGPRRRPVSRLSALLSVFALLVLFLLSSRRPDVITGSANRLSSPRADLAGRRSSSGSCNYSSGDWVRDSQPAVTRYGRGCKEIFKGWNCQANGKPNAADLTRWRWRPMQCELPLLDPRSFLERHKNTNIGFVGDSLNRNMFVSLVCMLKRVTGDVQKLRPAPAGADRGFTFLNYNLTVAYHRTELLVRYSWWIASPNGGYLESLGFKQGYRVDVDVPEQTWERATSFHNILIFNTGHWWWSPTKFDPVMIFFYKGEPVKPPLSPAGGFDLALKSMISYVEENSQHGSIKIFRTQSPRHFEGGDWNEGGTCGRNKPLSSDEVEQLFSLKNNGTNAEARLVNRHLLKAIKGSTFHMLDITRMSEFRADAHPSTAGLKKHDDCMHWCLPGLTDTWNDLLAATLEALA